MRSAVTSVSSESTLAPGAGADQRHFGLRLVDLDIFLQGMDQIFLEIAGRHRRFGDFAQRHDRIFVVVALDGNLRPGRDHARPVARQKDEIEAVFNFVDAIFYGDTGHRLVTPSRWNFVLNSPAR